MAIYSYKCHACGNKQTVIRSMKDSELPVLCDVDAFVMKRDFQADFGKQRFGDIWPYASYAAGVSPDQIPEILDLVLCRYLIHFIVDFDISDVQGFRDKIDYIYISNNYTEGIPKIIRSAYAMVKYTYRFQAKVNCLVLAQKLQKYSDFEVHFDEAVNKNDITLYLGYITPDEIKDNIHRKKERHTFTISSKGTVSQYSPHPQLAEIAYNYLFEKINQFNQEILSID